MKKRSRIHDLTTRELEQLRRQGRYDEVERELERQAKRFFSTPEPPDERAERRAFVEAAKRVLAREPEPDFPEAEEFLAKRRRRTRNQPGT